MTGSVLGQVQGLGSTTDSAEAFVTHETYRCVWLWIGDANKANPALIPGLWSGAADSRAFDGNYHHIKFAYCLLIDNLM